MQTNQSQYESPSSCNPQSASPQQKQIDQQNIQRSDGIDSDQWEVIHDDRQANQTIGNSLSVYDAIQLYKQKKLQKNRQSELHRTTNSHIQELETSKKLANNSEQPLLSEHLAKPYTSLNEVLRKKELKEINETREKPHKNAFELLKAYQDSQSSSDSDQQSEIDNRDPESNVNQFKMTRITYQKVP